MSYLVDTNVLLRLFDLDDPRNPDVVGALDVITKQTEEIHVCAQVLIEYWVVSTRPTEANGMGLSVAEADDNLSKIEKLFPCLPEPASIVRLWRDLVSKYSVCGRQAHDTRLAAVMLASGVQHILTLNPGDFARYEGIAPVTPQGVVRSAHA